ncbi:hypothetical protein HK102_007527, partial [Quaeritorhiza haematococci]
MTLPSSYCSSVDMSEYAKMINICMDRARKHLHEIKSLKESINEVTKRVAETKQQLALLEVERRRFQEEMDAARAEDLEIESKIQELQQQQAKSRERFSEFDEQLKKTEHTISEYERFVMTKEAEGRQANAKIEGWNKTVEALKLYYGQVFEMAAEDPEAPLPPVPDYHL